MRDNFSFGAYQAGGDFGSADINANVKPFDAYRRASAGVPAARGVSLLLLP
jgi:hypothetical protein